jgi:hypothetical protein
LREPPLIGLGDRRAPAGNTVIAAALVVELGGRTLAQFLDQLLVEHPLDRAIQGARTELEVTVRARRDILHDRVAVAVLVGQGHEDVKRRRGKGKKVVDVSGHTPSISTLDTISKSASPQSALANRHWPIGSRQSAVANQFMA